MKKNNTLKLIGKFGCIICCLLFLCGMLAGFTEGDFLDSCVLLILAISLFIEFMRE